jgi:hypothetical protein
VEEGSKVYFGKVCAVQKLIVLGHRFFVDGVGRMLTALLSFVTTRSHCRILDVRLANSVIAAPVPTLRNCPEDPFARFRLGVRGDDVTRQQLGRSAYMTKRSMDPFSADYYLLGNTGVPVQSIALHCMCVKEHSGRHISGQ